MLCSPGTPIAFGPREQFLLLVAVEACAAVGVCPLPSERGEPLASGSSSHVNDVEYPGFGNYLGFKTILLLSCRDTSEVPAFV